MRPTLLAVGLALLLQLQLRTCRAEVALGAFSLSPFPLRYRTVDCPLRHSPGCG